MSEKVYRIICEWDIGQEYQVFKSPHGARSWAEEALVGAGIDDPFDELCDEGLIYVDHLELLP